jgi:ATP-dependent Zn protease
LIQSVFFAFETSNQALFLNVPSVAQREYSEETAHRIDAEIEQLLKAAHGRVHTTLGPPGSNRARGMWYRRRSA